MLRQPSGGKILCAVVGVVLVQTSVMENAQADWLPELLAMVEAAGKIDSS